MFQVTYNVLLIFDDVLYHVSNGNDAREPFVVDNRKMPDKFVGHASHETAVVHVQEVTAKIAPEMEIKVAPPYYKDADYISALVGSAEKFLESDFDHLLFSFHGIPERHLRKSDPTDCHCLKVPNCCEMESPAHATCYRAQCFQTMKAFAAKTNLPAKKYSIAFQSRLGRDPWLTPYTDKEIERLARNGVKKLLVICPAFVSDCLETIEEIGMRGRETFLAAGGSDLNLIPCLNEHPLWIDALEKMTERLLGIWTQANEAEIGQTVRA